ncbi:MarR family transcriptional regulator [Pimelobacter simplex]|nr:MarR family transcriptional regulator [Pimelobacter simplex]MCG8154385.1 MarR family transcriptional regulator [Pimelobacter simplex]
MGMPRAERRPTMTAEARFTSPGYLLAHIGRMAHRRIADSLEPLDLQPREAAVLLVLRDHDGELSQQRLGQVLDMDPNYLVKALARLEDAGLVARRPDPDDRRRQVVTLSAAGRRRRAAADESVTRAESEILAGLSPEDAARLRELLLVLDRNSGSAAHD